MVFFSLLGVEASRSSFTSSGDHAKVFSLGQLFRSRWTASSLLIDRLSSYLYSSRLGTACWLASHPAERVTGVRIISNHKFSKHDGHNNWSENWTVYVCNINVSFQLVYLLLISAVMAMKACSTLVALFALVSMKGIPISSANAWREANQID